MIRSGQRILSMVLLVPILTILAHNAIPHHHHVTPVEICCDNLQTRDDNLHDLNAARHFPVGHHDACSFNPEFTFDLFKILITSLQAVQDRIDCPLKWIESDCPSWFTDNAFCRVYSPPNLLRGPPAIA